MRLLLDSHFCLWLALKPDRLSILELATILEPDNDIAYPSVALWELRIKWDARFVSGERKGEANPTDILDALGAAGLVAIDLSPEIAVTPLSVSIPHRDPFDELLHVIAQETGRKLLTRDEKLQGHPLAYHPG